MKKKIVFIILIFSSLSLSAQSKRSRAEVNDFYRKEVIEKMADFYQQGDLNSVISMFETHCGNDFTGKKFRLNSDFKRLKNELQAEIYDFTAKAYLAEGQLNKADFCMKKMFAVRYDESFRDYWLGIRTAYNQTYRIAPKFLLGIRGGLNKSLSTPLNSYSVFRKIAENSDNYSENYEGGFGSFYRTTGFEVGILAEYAVSGAFLVGFGANFDRFSFYSWNTNTWQQDVTVAKQFVNVLYQKQQTLNAFEFPLYFKFRSPEKRFRYEIAAGFSFSKVLSVAKVIDRTETPGITFTGGSTLFFTPSYQEINQNVSSQYVPVYLMPFGSLALTYSAGRFILTLDATYRYGVQNMIRSDMRYADNELVFRYHDVPDNQKFSTLTANLGIKLPLFYETFQRK